MTIVVVIKKAKPNTQIRIHTNTGFVQHQNRALLTVFI